MQQKAAVSIYLVVIVLIGILMIATAIASFMLLQQKMSIETGLSSKAYQAADSGIERILLAKKNKGNQNFTISDLSGLAMNLATEFDNQFDPASNWRCSGGDATIWFPVDSNNECFFCLEVTAPGDDEVITDFKSIGRCGSVQRAIQVTY